MDPTTQDRCAPRSALDVAARSADAGSPRLYYTRLHCRLKWAAHTATAASGTQRGAKSSSASSLTGLCVAWQRRIGAACTHFHTGDAHQVSGYAQQTFTGASARRLAQRIGLAAHVDVDGISQVSRIGISYGTVSRRYWAESNVLAAGGWRLAAHSSWRLRP